MPSAKQIYQAIHRHAMSYPGAWEDHPWDHVVVKVKQKIFLFLSGDPSDLGLSVKLPHSRDAVLTMFDFCEPTGYGLGKAGWISAHLDARNCPPIELIEAWVDESYRAIAPKTLIKELDARTATSAPASTTAGTAAGPRRGRTSPSRARPPAPTRRARTRRGS